MAEGAGGLLGSLGSAFGGNIGAFLGGPWGAVLSGLGGLFGGTQSLKQYQKGIDHISRLPGMQGPSNLFGDFGSAVGGGFQFNQALGGAQNLLSGGLQGLLNYQIPQALQGLNLGDVSSFTDSALSQTIGPMNAVASGAAQGLFDQGQANLLAAQDVGGLRNQQLDIMRQAFAPEAERRQVRMFDDLYSKGLLGPQTDTQGQSGIVRAMMESLNQADLGFQNEAFNRGMQQSQFLGNLGLQQIGQGFGAENQAFGQALQALGQNQTAGMQRLQAAQGLFGLGNDVFAQRHGLGLQGVESLLGMSDFGLRAARSPFELQAGLLSGSGQHADALQTLYGQLAKGTGGFFGGMFG